MNMVLLGFIFIDGGVWDFIKNNMFDVYNGIMF